VGCGDSSLQNRQLEVLKVQQNSGSRTIMPEKAVTSELVDRQQDAVAHTSGPLLILAGAGTGKTTTIAAKIAYMVQELRVDPEQPDGGAEIHSAARGSSLQGVY